MFYHYMSFFGILASATHSLTEPLLVERLHCGSLESPDKKFNSDFTANRYTKTDRRVLLCQRSTGKCEVVFQTTSKNKISMTWPNSFTLLISSKANETESEKYTLKKIFGLSIRMRQTPLSNVDSKNRTLIFSKNNCKIYPPVG